ncbi:hypothetical protein T492DRAFT_847638 [Pavlovales sp. CCMP2436]|nr:hypothetical protein T492DRAFT_847638 [Pavlovales sp. CCMP2436]
MQKAQARRALRNCDSIRCRPKTHASSTLWTVIDQSEDLERGIEAEGGQVVAMRQHSEMQLQVLRLYRDILRFARTKADEERTQIARHAREKFSAPILRTNVTRIEYLLGYGRRQLDMLKQSTKVQFRR